MRFESPCLVDEAARFVPSAPDEASRFVYENTYFPGTGMHPHDYATLTTAQCAATLSVSSP
jgi:hypothetical protein